MDEKRLRQIESECESIIMDRDTQGNPNWYGHVADLIAEVRRLKAFEPASSIIDE